MDTAGGLREIFVKLGANHPQLPAGRSNRARIHARRSAFTLVEALIILLAVGILAMVVFPQFHSEKEQAREVQLKDQLHYLRTQIMVFRAQHQDIPPGYPDGYTMASPTADAVVAQLTLRSNLTLNTSELDSSDYPYGPYLKQIPTNPMNGMNTFIVVRNNQAIPPPDGKTGWIYKPQTQELIANVPGADQAGTSYFNY